MGAPSHRSATARLPSGWVTLPRFGPRLKLPTCPHVSNESPRGHDPPSEDSHAHGPCTTRTACIRDNDRAPMLMLACQIDWSCLLRRRHRLACVEGSDARLRGLEDSVRCATVTASTVSPRRRIRRRGSAASSWSQPAFGNPCRAKDLVGANLPSHVGEWIHILPDDFPRRRDLEEAPIGSLADQSIAVRLALRAADELAEESPDRAAALLGRVLGHNRISSGLGHSEQ